MERETHVSVDEIFSLLSHNRRRLALQYFRQHSAPFDLDDLAFMLARWEGPSTTTPAAVEVEQVKTALTKTHLPKFVEIGLVEYRQDTQTVVSNDEPIVGAMENAITVIGFLYAGSDGAATD